MTKARIEGLLAAFPKLITSGKQHTFVESDSVRYVYQPMDKLYIVLITTKTSNILEDLETLRLFSKVVSDIFTAFWLASVQICRPQRNRANNFYVSFNCDQIPEYCRNMDEKDISDNAFNLIFAFDEIVALGYRESVNLAQIKTFVEMDSHEEKVYLAVRQTQEREAKQKMREKAKELQRQRLEATKRGVTLGRSSGNSYMGVSSSSFTGISSASSMASPAVGISEPVAPSPSIKWVLCEATRQSWNSIKYNFSFYCYRKPAPSRNALKLGGKSKDVDSFVDQLKSEGQKVTNLAPTPVAAQTSALKAKSTVPAQE